MTALKRIEERTNRANSNHQPGTTVAAAIAYAPERENDMSETVPPTRNSRLNLKFLPKIRRLHLRNRILQSFQRAGRGEEPRKVQKRVIVENDPALNYLDSISRTVRVDDLSTKRASVFRRIVCALIDLIFCALLSSPIALAVQITGNNLQDTRVIAVLAGVCDCSDVHYLTLMTALTGRHGPCVCCRCGSTRRLD